MNQKLKDERELLSGPGDTILETIEFMKMSQVELGLRIGKTPSKVNDLITGKEPITMTTALQLENALGIEASFWLTRELKYREKLARIEQEEGLEEFIDWINIQPVKELRNSGYLKALKPGPEMGKELMFFYGINSPRQWQSLYVDNYASAVFRMSDKHQTELASMAAWLRIGEIQMRKMELPIYNKDNFKTNLILIRKLVKTHPEDFAERLQRYCFTSGVALIYTICISKAPISGAARWIGGNPLIQLTDRYKSNDQFWFTFFHEAGHICLHGKKDAFIENFEGYEPDDEKEAEADAFANKNLIPEDLPSNLPEKITENIIREIAQKNDTHPAIILGRLQHLGKLPYTYGTNLKIKVDLDDLTNNRNNL
jgi:HTH-type transcriptional regulator / antitoxin HigA